MINPLIVIVVSVDESSSLVVVLAGVDVSAFVRYKPNTSISESERQNDLFRPHPDYHSQTIRTNNRLLIAKCI